MKPQFALSLSFDDIALLIRSAKGWHSVGHVAPDQGDLPTELAILRSKAEDLAKGDLHSKLVLPDAQIRYLSIETGELHHDARLAAARKALEGATPYPVSALAYDISADGKMTHIAAVALETLEEAESFAVEHGFGPVSFVAAPEAGTFLGEPFFGTARAARGLEIEPDTSPVLDLGPMPAPDTSAAPEAAEASPEDSAETNAKAEAPSAKPEATKPAKPAQKDSADTLTPAPAATQPAPIVLPAAPEAGDMSLGQLHLQLRPEDLHEEDSGSDTSSEGGPVIGFSSRRNATATVTTSEARSLTADRTTPDRKTPELKSPKAEARAKPAPAAPAKDARKATDAASPAKSPQVKSGLPAAPTLAMPTPVLAHTTSAPPKPASQPKATPVAGPVSDMIQTPQARPLRSRSGRIGLVAAALATVTAIGAWAVVRELPDLWSDLKRADLVGAEDPVATPILAHAEATVTAPALTDTSGPNPAAPLLPQADQTLATGATATPSPFASQGSDPLSDTSATADQSLDAQDTPSDLTVTDAAVLEALGTPVVDEATPVESQDLIIASLPAPRVLSDEGRLLNDGGQELDPASLPNEVDANTVDPEALADGIDADNGIEDGIDGSVADLEEAAQYAATGIWQKAPEIAEAPRQIDLEDVYVASIDNTELSQDAVALPAQTALDTDLSFGAIRNPSAANSQFDLDDRGLVKATPEGTVNPDGITIYAGRPVKVPPATPDRPTAAEVEAAETAERIALLTKKRPRVRPNDLVEQTERAQLGGVVRAELLSKRPKTRPETLKTEEEESQPATALAVASASKPRARPANFANIVDRAQRSTQSQPDTQSASAVPAAVSPSIPSSASVARQATVPRALNLRRINLIGVYGKPSERRALVRLPSGRYVKVKVGDRIDGGRIVAIGDTQLQYQKGGRNQTLTLPNG